MDVQLRCFRVSFVSFGQWTPLRQDSPRTDVDDVDALHQINLTGLVLTLVLINSPKLVPILEYH